MQISTTLPPEFVRADRRFCSTVIQQLFENNLRRAVYPQYSCEEMAEETTEDQQHELFLIK